MHGPPVLDAPVLDVAGPAPDLPPAALDRLGKAPEDFRHVVAAHEMGFGQIDPSLLNLRRITV